MAEGWIKLYRKIMEHPFYQEKRPFSRFEAWLDLLMRANHKDTKIVLGNEVVEVRRGSFITSEVKLMERWNWSKTKVRAYLTLLEKDNMIVKISDRKKTTISICNYSLYQDLETTEELKKDREETAKKPQTRHRQEVKNNKNEKKKDKDNPLTPLKTKFADFVSLTNDEYMSLVARLGSEDRIKRAIEILDNYKGATGKTYKSDYRAILNWVIGRLEEEEQKKGGQAREPTRKNTTDWDEDKFYTTSIET